ncbi:hypothetical protein KJ762_09100 [bacterium]|nr:hypothetical protein [bacterium]MBU1063671.1 hypothetical protein [bacterium]MBU1634650.1 hypothetical protein [bacterium]
MSYYHHTRRKRKKLKSIEKKLLYAIIPLSFIVAFGIQIVVKGIPQWIYIMIGNMRMEESISRALIRGSAVRQETKLRQDYEKSYREKHKDYDENYIDMLENRGDKEIKEYEQYFKKEDEDAGGL